LALERAAVNFLNKRFFQVLDWNAGRAQSARAFPRRKAWQPQRRAAVISLAFCSQKGDTRRSRDLSY
jgi:hypothetical protein